MWIGTFGGGISTLRKGVFHHYGIREGLLSDNVSHVEDDGTSLWLSTDGESRHREEPVWDLNWARRPSECPTNFGISDGLRSAQCAPAFPAGRPMRSSDGNLWFPTSNGLATINPRASFPDTSSPHLSPLAHIVEIAIDGHSVGFKDAEQIKAGVGRIQFRYSGIYLRAPERVRFSYKLEGLDRDWISAGARRLIDYNPLPHGSYRFLVQAAIAGSAPSGAEFAFEVLPRFYETRWFVFLCCVSLAGLAFGLHQFRLRQIHGRFALVVEERARMAREIHDTLAQGFVGISLQLDTLETALDDDPGAARQYLNHAQKMARHSLTEARQSMADLRTPGLPEQSLPAILTAAMPRWVAGSRVEVRLNVPQSDRKLPADLAQNLLRIAQEAVTNAVKHAMARVVRLDLNIEDSFLRLRIEDDGRGFEPADTFSVSGGHFGIVGMRERTERLGGEFDLASRPGNGTQVEVRVPLLENSSRSGR